MQAAKNKKVSLNFKVIFCGLAILVFILSLVMPAFSRSGNEIVINVPSRTLELWRAGHLIQEYSVGVGASKSMMTPPGVYTVDDKIINPIWEHPYKAPGESRIGSGEKNPLGTRWIGFHSGGGGVYGIHGTNEPNSIGKFVSHGCVRMKNRSVEDLFELVDFGAKVTVTYNRFKLKQVGDVITLEVFPDPYKYKAISIPDVLDEVRKIDPLAQVDYEMLTQAIADTSDKSVYEIAKFGRSVRGITYPAQTNPNYQIYDSNLPNQNVQYQPVNSPYRIYSSGELAKQSRFY